MGIDIYVGPLSRYYAHAWQRAELQPAGAPASQTVLIDIDVGAGDGPDVFPDEILGWRRELSDKLEPHIGEALDWDERPMAPFYTDRLEWDPHVALAMWAAYEAVPTATLPNFLGEQPFNDPILRRAGRDTANTPYTQITRSCQLWLPNAFGFTVRAPLPTGVDVMIGSSVALLEQLNQLNQRTWAASRSTLERWLADGPPPHDGVEPNAKYGFAVMHRLAMRSVRQRLPMKLDG
jgi:hypothetical protein